MIAIGDRLDNKYRVTRLLGGGGFGEVFLADDEAIPGRQVAIKVLSQPKENDHSDLIWEMQALAKFHHPRVVAFYHHFSDEERLYLVMEFCAGGCLSDRLKSKNRCTEEQVFAWGLELCDTLAFVHDKGIVHHDIKPPNILFATDGTIKLGDFGVANRHAGTLIYLPPEMLLGERVSKTDARVDIYALGLTLLELLSGDHPFARCSTDEALQSRIAHDFIPTTLPRWVQEVLLKATHPTPEMRFQTAADFGNAIRAKHVSYVFDGDRIKADALANKALAAIGRKKWTKAMEHTSHALALSPDCVAALLAAGRCQLLIHRVEKANEYFSKAVSVNPRTPVQKELGWINLEQGRIPTGISLLTDHLQRNASDFEAYNLLLKAFYLTDRFEAGDSLARTMWNEKAPNDCFRNNGILCAMLNGGISRSDLEKMAEGEKTNPFLAHNLKVATEKTPTWDGKNPASLKAKLLFQEYQFAPTKGAGRENTVAIYMPNDDRQTFRQPIISIGSQAGNDLVLNDKTVSRRHCVIVNFPGDVWLYDLGSTVGTVIDGQRLIGRMHLDGVQEVAIGRVKIRIASSSDRLL